MFGHGSPTSSQYPIDFAVLCRRLVIAATLIGLASFGVASATAEPIDMRVRVAWGGGESRQWNVTVSLSEGSLETLKPIGFEADEPASMQIYGREIRIAQRSPRLYDGFDVDIQCDSKAVLMLTFTPADGSPAPEPIQLPIPKIRAGFQSLPIDKQNNRLLVRRSPGDALRLKFPRESLVFTTGETFSIQPQPHLASAPPNSEVTISAALFAKSSGEEVWRGSIRRKTNQAGDIEPPPPFEVKIPPDEGIYQLDFELTPVGGIFVGGGGLFGDGAYARRSVQLVALTEKTNEKSAGVWHNEFEIDPAERSMWNRMKQLPIPGWSEKVLGNDKGTTKTHLGKSMLSLAPTGWRGFPLTVHAINQPHILEIDYPADLPQTVSLSIVEPDASGQLTPLGIDSGFHTPEKDGRRKAITKHRIPFWPRTANPVLLVVNRDPSRAAVISNIRLLSGAESLPRSRPTSTTGARKILGWYDKPLFAENFSAPQALDLQTGRTLDDWQKFYEGGRRLVEYLQYAGYDGAVVSVACEGSAIYPSELLQPTPKYDTGVFFSNGQDARRKDVLEMLMRMFDRAGLTLIPSVQFSSPLPELEYRKLSRPREAVGIDLVNPDGKPWPISANNQTTVHYNPLDERTAGAMVRVIGELADRYQHHSAFGGACLRLGENSHAQLPDLYGGYDTRTIGRFEQELGIRTGDTPTTPTPQRAANLLGRYRTAWLHWRALQLNRMFQQMQARVAAVKPGAKIYLSPTESFTAQSVQAQLRPRLPERGNAESSLLEIGLSLDLLSESPGVVVIHPHMSQVGRTLTAGAVADRLTQDVSLSDEFKRAGSTATLLAHRPYPTGLPEFDQVSPFANSTTKVWMASHILPSEQFNRQRFVHAIAASDALTLMEGGWMLPLGQEAASREVLEVFRQLPAKPFREIPATDEASQTEAVKVRSLDHNGATYLYAINDSPYSVEVVMDLRGSEVSSIESLSDRRLPPLTGGKHGLRWTIMLKPYDMVAGRMQQPGVRVSDWKLNLQDGEAIRASVVKGIRETRLRAAQLSRPTQLPEPANASFEEANNEEAIPGWKALRKTGVSAVIDRKTAFTGDSSLHLTSSRPVAWVRSTPMPAPTTGRLSVWVWLKTTDASKQPTLRLAIEGKLNDQTYYKYAPVGAGDNARDLLATWEAFIFHIDDLPTSGLTDLRVGFDLMGEGEVWIDEVRIYDRWFNPNTEVVELMKRIAVADRMVTEQNRVLAGARFLESYWPQFLARNIPLEESAVAALPRRSASGTPVDKTPPPPPVPTILDRVRSLAPKRIWPF